MFYLHVGRELARPGFDVGGQACSAAARASDLLPELRPRHRAHHQQGDRSAFHGVVRNHGRPRHILRPLDAASRGELAETTSTPSACAAPHRRGPCPARDERHHARVAGAGGHPPAPLPRTGKRCWAARSRWRCVSASSWSPGPAASASASAPSSSGRAGGLSPSATSRSPPHALRQARPRSLDDEDLVVGKLAALVGACGDAHASKVAAC